MIWFEWDDSKALANSRKHGIEFDAARLVFEDPEALSEQDRIEGGESRWRTIGRARGVLLMVAYTVCTEGRDEVVRIISARRADRKERIRYEQNCQNNRA